MGADFRSLFGLIGLKTTTRGLEPEQVQFATNWNLAYYDSDFLAQLGLPPDHNKTLRAKLEELRKQAEQEGAKSGNN